MPSSDSLARHAGIAYALAEQLRLFPRHAARRQLFVPLDILQRYGANAEDVFAGKSTPQLRAALAEMRLHIRGHLTAADDLLVTAPAAVLPAFLPIALVRPLLKKNGAARLRSVRQPSTCRNGGGSGLCGAPRGVRAPWPRVEERFLEGA